MKISKKIGIGLVFLLTALTSIAFISRPALAAVASSDISGATYAFQDRGNIVGDFGASGKVTFTDNNPFDSTRNYTPSQGGFCDPGTIPDQNGIKGNIRFGINISSGASLTSPSIAAQAKLGYSVGQNCVGVLENISVSNPQTPVPVAAATFEWNGDTITTFPGETDKTLTFSATTTTNSTALYLSNQSNGACPNNGAILLSQANGNQGVYYVLSGVDIAKASSPSNLSQYPALNATGAVDGSKCRVDSTANITISGTAGTQAVGGPNSVASTGDANSSCEASSGSPLAWLMCPLFSAASAVVQSTINIFEGLLSFTVAQDLSNTSCSINNQGCQDSVRLTWSILKNIASIVLVIIMLVMVFSQAISVGPFDAYTLRKILPKLVAAVILMQLSWPLVAWIIDLFNDFGKGLQDLLYAPFGGANTLNSLPNLINHAINHAGIGGAGAAAFNWVGILAVGIATLAALPTALFMASAALIGLFVAIITLIFRKILIIMLLIFAPLALVAWILPGTQRYWKLWSDNLIKVLAMYPLVVAIIAVGRIFAYVAGPQTNVLLALLFVLVGFIGPLFILPRTFKWGGGIMSAAGGALMNAGNRLNKGIEQPLKGLGERQQGKWAKQYNPEASLRNRTLRRIQSGNILPTKRSQRLAIAAGDKWQSERDDEALALINRKGEKAREGYDAIERNGQGEMLDANGNVTTDATRAARKRLAGVAAMKQMWVDLAESGRDDHERKMAIKKLISTSSWPEVQGSFTASGKRVIDTDAWRNGVTTSEEDYPKVLRSRVDAAPHIIDGANQVAERAGFAPGDDSIEARNFKSAYRINYAIDKQMSNEDFATQSDGFWQETERMANLKDSNGRLTAQALEIRANLKNRLQAIHDIGGTAPQQLLGHLASGGSLEASINSALGDTTIREYITPGAVKTAAAAATTAPSGRSYETNNVEGGERTVSISRENIQNMTEGNASNWVASQGGYAGMSNQDLVVLYNVRRDAVQQAARDELQRRGLFNPEGGPNFPPDVEPPPAPPAGPDTSGGGIEGGLDVPHDIPPEEFGPDGRFRPPNIPPGPGNV